MKVKAMATEKLTGAISFALFGISATLSAADAKEWGQTLMELAPLILIGFLAFSLHNSKKSYEALNKKHEDCQETNAKLNNKIILLYASIRSGRVRARLPEVDDFNSDQFDLHDIIPQDKLPRE